MATTALPLKYHDVMIALGKAESAWWMLDRIIADDLNFDGGRTDIEIPRDDLRDWLTGIAADTLLEAIHEARAAFIEGQAGEGPTRPKDGGPLPASSANVIALRSRAGGLDKTEGA